MQVKTIRTAVGVIVNAALLFAGLFVVWPVLDVVRNQITVYPITVGYDGIVVPLNRSVYRVFPDAQAVVYWKPGFDTVVPRRLHNCAIRDRRNWRCEYSDGSGIVTTVDGAFSVSLDPTYGSDYFYVGRLSWWKLRLLDR